MHSNVIELRSRTSPSLVPLESVWLAQAPGQPVCAFPTPKRHQMAQRDHLPIMGDSSWAAQGRVCRGSSADESTGRMRDSRQLARMSHRDYATADAGFGCLLILAFASALRALSELQI